MFIAQYILENYVMLFELGGLLMVVSLSVHITEKMKKATRLIVAMIFFESISFHLERLAQALPTYNFWRPFLTSWIYTIYPLILICLMTITVMRNIRRKKLIILIIPEIVSIPLYFTSQWTHLVCYYSDDNRYIAGPLYRWPYFIFVFYSFVFVFYNIQYFKGFSAKERFLPMYIILFPLCGVIYYMIFREGRDYSGLISSALLVYYIFIYIHMAKIDPLTGLLNRQSYYKDIKVKEKEITAIVSIDMNNLKYLNDNFGHKAGDMALKVISAIFKEIVFYKGSVYRIGGDEFVILYFRVDVEAVRKVISKMREKIESAKYRCAFGYTMIEKNMNIDEAAAIADKMMYINKAEMKANKIPQ